MTEQQENLYKLLKEVDGICKRNGITYYLAGGAALGAVRGGGFLPWDDDIDLYITRDNWNRLIEVMHSQTPVDRNFVCTEEDPLYCNPVGRYVDCNTTLMLKSQILDARACGQMVEFFVFDAMPADQEGKMEHRRYMKAYCELLSPYFVCNDGVLDNNSDFDRKLYRKALAESKTRGRDTVLEEMKSRFTQTEEKDSDCWCMCWGRRTLMYPRETFGEPRYVKFEDGLFPVPAGQEKIARIAYGDTWMYVPNQSGQITHDISSSFYTPFKLIVDRYMPLIDVEKTYNAFEKNKRIRTEAVDTKMQFNSAFALARMEVAKPAVESDDDTVRELRRLYNEKEDKTLENKLADFFAVQFNSQVKSDGLLMDVSDDYLSVAADYLIRKGDYYKAGSFLKARCRQNRPLSESLLRTKETYDYCRALSVAIYDDICVEKAEQILADKPELNWLIDTIRARLWVMKQKAQNDKDYELLIKTAEDYRKIYEEDGEILSYIAYALYKMGRSDEARSTYLDAVKKTRNGFIWRQADELFGINAFEESGDKELKDDADGDRRDAESGETHVDVTDTAFADETGTAENENLDLSDSQFRTDTLKRMLGEIDDICRENGLKYSLTGTLANEIYDKGAFPHTIDQIDVAMTAGDVVRFTEIINKGRIENRIVECVRNNPKARTLNTRYVNTATTLISIKEFGNHTYYGLFVTLIPVKVLPEENLATRIHSYKKKMWKGAQKRPAAARWNKRVVSALSKGVKFLVGEERMASALEKEELRLTMIDKWSDIADCDIVKCGKLKVFNNEYIESDDGIERNWDLEELESENRLWMVCNQFYDKRVASRPPHNWVSVNEITSSRPYSQILTDEVVRALLDAQKLRDTYIKSVTPAIPYMKTINEAWRMYKNAKEAVEEESKEVPGVK